MSASVVESPLTAVNREVFHVTVFAIFLYGAVVRMGAAVAQAV
jgi:hypothetical protein